MHPILVARCHSDQQTRTSGDINSSEWLTCASDHISAITSFINKTQRRFTVLRGSAVWPRRNIFSLLGVGRYTVQSYMLKLLHCFAISFKGEFFVEWMNDEVRYSWHLTSEMKLIKIGNSNIHHAALDSCDALSESWMFCVFRISLNPSGNKVGSICYALLINLSNHNDLDCGFYKRNYLTKSNL